MKVEIGKEKENGTKYTASLISEEKLGLPKKFDTWRDLRAYLNEERKKAQASGQPFELVRKSN